VKLILLVDDSNFQRIAIGRMLTKAGYDVLTVGDGEEALRTASARIPDLVLLDMLLPKLSGPEVLRALKKSPVTASIPVIALSGLSQKNEAKLINEGAAGYMEKSLIQPDDNFEPLLQMVDRTLRG